MMQTPARKRIYVNPKQIQFLQARQPIRVFIGGRGSGKSTVMGIDDFGKVREMPKAKGALVGLTYGQILTKFLPPVIQTWASHGLKRYESEKEPGHYVIGRRPPANWPKAFAPPESYKNVISFINGTCIEMISLDRKDTGRGGSYDWMNFDEAVLIPRDRHDREMIPSVRGNSFKFNSRLHHSVSYFSSQSWLPSGNWVPDMRYEAMSNPDEVFYTEATAYDNISVLGEKYIDRQRKLLTPMAFDVEVLNKRPDKLPNSFYGHFSEERHTYWEDTYSYHETESGLLVSGFGDTNPNSPLLASFDFNAGFNSCITAQNREQEGRKEIRVLKNFFVKGTKIINDLVKEITSHYDGHRRKHVVIYGDRNGNNRQPNSPYTFYEQIQLEFHAQGWTTELKVEGLDPPHKEKWLLINTVLEETNPAHPRIRMNKIHCKELILSIGFSPVLPDFKKDKRSEKRDIDQEFATHLSDCFDNLIHPLCKDGFGAGNMNFGEYDFI